MQERLLNEAIDQYHDRLSNIQTLCEEFSKLVQEKHGLTDEQVDTVTSLLGDYVRLHGSDPSGIHQADIARAIRVILQRLGVDNTKIYRIVTDPLIIKNFAQHIQGEFAEPEPEPVVKKRKDPFPAPGMESIEQKLQAVFFS